jgi:lipid-A-disaccharide synthase
VDKELVPEFLQHQCNAPALADFILNVYKQPEQLELIKNELSVLKEILSDEQTDCTLFDLVERTIE